MASEGTAAEKRATLVASRPLWSNVEVRPSVSSLTQGQDRAGDSSQESVREWLTTINEVDPKPEQSRQAPESLKRNASSEDDLALGVEASLYGKHGVRTVQEFLWSTRPDLSRWNSVTSALSTQSSPLSVMDVLNLWKDDPEEVLFDLGFGIDEPDVSGRIPARFINHQSHARGISIQVLLEAQKNRLDVENPDVSNRFRQLEVLQQVTTAFSTLVGGPAPSASPHAGAPSPGRDLSAEARERRRRMGMLFRKASRRNLGQPQIFQEQPPASSPSDQPEQPPSSIADKPASLRRTRLVLQESISLSPLAEEQGTLLDSPEAPTVEARLGLGKEIQALTSSAALARKRSPGQARESFEMEEIQSFDDSSIAGSYSGTGDSTAQAVMRTNSCQSDSSGFLEEPFIPSLHSLQLSPGPEHGPWPRYGPWPGSGPGLGSGPGPGLGSGPGLESGSVHGIGTEHLKALSGGSTDSQVTVKEASLDRSCPASPSPPPSPTSVSSPTSLSNLPSPSSPTSLSNLPSPSSPTSLSNLPSPSSPTSLSNLPSPSSPTSLSNLPSPSSPTSLSNLPSPSSPTSLSNFPSPSSPTSPSSSSHFPLFTSRFPNPSSLVFPSSLHFSSSSANDISATPHFSPTSAACYSIYPSSPYPSSPTSPSCLSKSLPGSASPLERPASPVERQASPVERPDSPLKTPASVLERPVSPFGRPNLLFERPDVTLERPDSSGRTPETPAERDGISDTAMGTAPSLMEDVFFGEDGKFSHCGISCHNNPDSSFRDVRKRDTDHFTLGAAGSREGEEEGESEKAGGGEGVNDGAMEGENEGEREGENEGENEGEREGENEVGTEGEREGENDGVMEGEREGENKGEREGENEGEREVENEVATEGEREGENEGVMEGEREGENKGEREGEREGESDGADADTVQTENVDCDLGMDCSGTAGDPVVLDQGETDCLGLIEIEALESVFGCSTEALEAVGEDEETDRVCEEDDRDKPISVSESDVSAEPGSLSSPVHVERHRFQSLGRSTFSIVPPLAPAPIPTSTPTPADLQRGTFRSQRSVSVQMLSPLSSSSSLSTSLVSHDNALRPLPQSHLPDRRTSPSERARSDGDSDDDGGSDSAPVAADTNAATIPERPSFPPSSPRWRSRSRYSSQRSESFRATSPDAGPCQEQEQEGGGEDEEVDARWRGALRGGTGACCSCEHRCSCCAHNSWQKQPSAFPYSVDELEGMMRCLKKFCSVLTDMEERLSEDQASVYSSLSLTDREEVRDILELRNAVKQEAGELELQLTDLVHHYDDSFKMKMNRLLDEQSFLRSQLRLLPPATTPTPSHTSTRNVATQCCMLPCSPLADISEPHPQSSGSSRDLDSRPPLPVSNSTDEGLDGSSSSKSEKLDFVGLLQKLKKSLRHSVNTDSLE